MPIRILTNLVFAVSFAVGLTACPADPTTPAEPEGPTDAGELEQPDGGVDDSDAGPPPPECVPDQCGGSCSAIPDVDGARERCVGEGPAFLNDNCSDGGIPPGLEFENHCCSDADCTESPGGICADGNDSCGGAPPSEGLNTCRYPDCTGDGDCAATEICAPAFFRNTTVARCIEAACTTDADCTDEPGGRCDFYGDFGPCSMPTILACSYPSNDCGSASGQECTNGQFLNVCYPNVDRTGVSCTELPPPPP